VQDLSNAIVLPLAAVNRGPKGQYVFVIGPDHKAATHPIAVLSVQGQDAVIKSGVKAGDVIVSGLLTLNNGSLVRLVKPGAAAATPGVAATVGAPSNGKAAAGKPSS
jgi:multidrug efflux pump subunit AcrA (membrane-fusion protein)